MADLQNDLQEILSKILAGQTDEARLSAELDELLTDSTVAQEPSIQALVLHFCSGLVMQLRSDSLGFRVALLAEFACRLEQWIGLGADALTALSAEHLMRLKDYEKSLSILERALEITPRYGTADYRLVEALRAGCLERLSRFADADRHVADYELSYQPLPCDHVTIEMLLTGAVAASALSNTEIAYRRAIQAISEYERVRNTDAAASSLPEILLPPLSACRLHAIHGQIIRKSGDILRAIEEFQRGREEGKAEGDARGAAICLSEIGITWERAGEGDRGARLLSLAAEEAQACGEIQMATRWRNMVVVDPEGRRLLHGFDGLASIAARVRGATGPPDEETFTITKNIIIEARDTNRELESLARNALAGLYAMGGKFNQAIAQLKVAIQIVDSTRDQWSGMMFRANLANISFRAKRFVEAEDAAQEALDRAKTFARSSNASEVRQASAVAVMNASEVLFLLWGLAMATSAGEVRPPNPNKIVALEQQVRSRNFDRWLALMNWAQSDHAERPHQIVYELIEAEIAVEAVAQAGGSLSAPLQALERASITLASGYPTVSQQRLLDEKSPGLEEAIDRLPENDILLDLNPVQSGLICIVAGRRRKPECFEIPWGRDARIKWSERWRYLSEGPAYRSRRRRTRMPASVRADPCEQRVEDRFETALTDLDEQFVGPLYEHIGPGPTRIICATHSELFGIPLWSLSRAAPDLVLSVVPSIASISLLATRPASRGTRSVKIGDATETLPMVPRELAGLASFESIEPERTKLSQELSEVRLLHFAGHGEFLETDPYASGIVIRGAVCSPYALADADERCVRLTLQGLIHDWHVTECDLVVLSACSTGIPRSHGASEFTSVSTTLLLAGARNVIAASWPADDVAAMLLMGEFYEALKDHLSPARALAEARCSLQMMDREAALTLIKEENLLPSGQRPFSSSVFTDTFLHFGVD